MPLDESDPGAAPVTGHADERMQSFDRLMTAFLTLHEIPGASLAVTKDSRLVYARGFGFADVEKQLPVQPESLFRVASVSKPVTGVAICKLIDDGKLKLDDRIRQHISLEPHLESGANVDPRWDDVTLQQLLQHTGGWDRAVSFDPMFRSVEFAKALSVEPPAMPDHVIRCMLGKPLDFAPGERFAYSNFGYCLLGRAIETVTGKTYEAYVRDEVLRPLNIRRMRIGKTLPSGRVAGEVTFYDEQRRTGPSVFAKTLGRQVPLPYGAWHLEAMDAHGGWIASAIDLVRFASTLDHPDRSSTLSPQAIQTLFACPPGAAGHDANGSPKPAYYACGWNVRPTGNGKANHWHGGALDGTASWLVRRSDGLNWAVLFNSRSSIRGEYLGEAIDFFLHRAADKVKEWPDHDLFKEHLPA